MKISVTTWNAISTLFDEALDLEPAARPAWLERLQTTKPELAPSVRRLLAAHATTGSSDVLSRLPTIDSLTGTENVLEEQLGLVADDRVGPYQLKRELGAGGMADVWLAARADGAFARDVALKLPRFSRLRRDLAVRFAREREILARLEHPHIARLYDAGVSDDGLPYLAMEFVDGQPINTYSTAKGLSIKEKLGLILQAASAVAYAHSLLVVHRDLKPSNIFVNIEGQVRLLDFGIAKLLQGELAKESQLTIHVGRALTLDYASPEQIRGEPIGVASDVYSLGVVAYELLTDAKPYRLKRQSAAALEEAIASVDVRLASLATSDARARHLLKGDLDAILNKALKKNVAERYHSVEAFARDIERYLAHLPVQAQPDRAGYRMRKFLDRNRLAASAAGVIALSIVAGAGVATWKAIEARDARIRAERVKELIGSIFESANPYVSGKSELTVRDLLKHGVERVERDLGGEPAVSAELLGLLSSSYRSLGDVDLALAASIRANELAAVAYAADHPLRARALRVLAEAHSYKGNDEEARRLVGEAIAIQRRLGDEGVPELARSLGLLASLVLAQGREQDAIGFAQESAQALVRVRGERDPASIAAIGELSNKLMIGRRNKEALTEAQRAHRLARAAFADPDHPLTTHQLSHYAYALQANGQNQEARDKWRSVVESNKRTFNPRGPQVAASLVGLGRSEEFLGNLKSALSSYEDSLAMMEGYGVKASSELAVRYFSIGRVALQARQPLKAVSFLEGAIKQGTAAYGAKSARVRDAENLYAAALIYAGRLPEAETMLMRQIAEARQNKADALPRSLANGALLDRARGDARAALKKLVEVRDIESGRTSNSRKSSAQNSSELIRAELDAGNTGAARLDAAATSLTAAIAIFSEDGAMPTPQQVDAWVTLGRIRLEQGMVDEALQWHKRATGFWEEFDAQNVFAGEAMFWHGAALMAKQQPARKPLLRSAGLLDASLWPSHKQLAQRARKMAGGGQ
jgi:eukaryotic-like serine/threonine-protein kinase